MKIHPPIDEDTGGYRWSCPLCGESRNNRLDVDGEKAEASLRTHVLSSDDEDHGPATYYPSNLDADTLQRHVDPIEGRE